MDGLRDDGTLNAVLAQSLALMPNLTNLYFNSYGFGKRLAQRAYQETRSWPQRPIGLKEHPRQCDTLISILADSGVQLQRLEMTPIQGGDISNSSGPLQTIKRNFRYLALHFILWRESTPTSEKALQALLKICPLLETLDLRFDKAFVRHVRLDKIFPQNFYFHKLVRLTLFKIRVSQLDFIHFLSRHSSSLRTLDLAHMDFKWTEARDGICAGLGTDFIRFLQGGLRLTGVSLEGYFSNQWGQAWISRPCEPYSCNQVSSSIPPEERLRHRIEQFIINGGACPWNIPSDRAQEPPESY